MNLVEQIFAQAQIGGHASSGNPFAEGVQLGQSQQRINLANQQLAQELAQWQVKQTLMQQEQKMNALKLEKGMQERQDYVDSTAQFTNLSNTISPLLKAGKLDEAHNMVLAAGLDNSFLLTDPRYKALTAQMEEMDKTREMIAYRQSMLGLSRERLTTQTRLAEDRIDIAEEKNLPPSERLEKRIRYYEGIGDAAMVQQLQEQATIAKEREQRLREQFDFQREKFSATVPRDKLALFHEKAMAIRNDLSLLSKPDEMMKRLDTLYNEIGAKAAPILAAPAPTAPAAKVLVRDKTGKLYRLPASQLDEAIAQGFEKVK